MILDKMREIIEKSEKTQEEVGELLGLAQSSLSLILSGKRKLKNDFIMKFCEVFKVSPSDLYSSVKSIIIPHEEIPVVGFVQAGVFGDATQIPETEQIKICLSLGEQYKRMRKFCLEVRGDSMDMVYPEGSILACVLLEDYLSYNQALDGKRVIVQRRNDALEVESTVKEYRSIDGRVWLMPHSKSGKYTPIILSDDGGQSNATIIGVVVGSYREED